MRLALDVTHLSDDALDRHVRLANLTYDDWDFETRDGRIILRAWMDEDGPPKQES